MNTFRSRKLAAAAAVSLGLAAGMATSPVSAQSSAVVEGETQTLEKFVITGSYIPYSAEAPAVPVMVLGAREIGQSGETGDLLEVIRKAAPQFIGNANIGSSNSNVNGGLTNGGSQLSLRNLATLVLINGRRAAFAPVGATGGADFVDVNSIPVSAVESIEVLKDGASALYGSDAVSGVVNIKLKQDYEGVQLGGRYEVATGKGHWEERKVSAFFGAKVGKTSLTFSAEWLKSDPLFQSERAFSADQTGQTSSFPGVVLYFGDEEVYYLNPGALPPLNADLTGAQLAAMGIYSIPDVPVSSLFNLSPYVTLAMGNEKVGFTTMLTHTFSDRLEFFSDLLVSRTETFYQLAAQPIVGMPYFAEHAEGFGGPVGYTLPDHPQNPFDDMVLVRNRFSDHPRTFYSDNDSFHGVAGFRGAFTENIRWEAAANLNKVVQDYRNENVIDRQNLADAIDRGDINLFLREQDPEKFERAQLFGTSTSRNESSLTSFDARTTGLLPDLLPAGDLGFAVGAETRKETLKARPDAGSYTIVDPTDPLYGSPADWDGATSFDDFNVDRRVYSFFAEVRAPLLSEKQAIAGVHLLELSAAVRHDRYSDTDDPTVPKLTLRYLPFNDELAIRASYSESFSAAPLYSLFGPSTVGFSDQPIGLRFVDGRIMTDDSDQAFLRVQSNPELEPESSKNYNIGLIYSPRGLKGLTVEATYFNIKQDDVVGSVLSTDILQDVETHGANSIYADRVRVGSFNGSAITAPGQISQAYDAAGGSFARVFMTNREENFSTGLQDGLDVTVNYAFDANGWGTVDLSANALWYNRYEVDGNSYVGLTNGNTITNGGTIPRWIGNFRGAFSRGSLTAGFNVYYVPEVDDEIAALDETDSAWDRHVEAWTNVDVFVEYAFRGDSRFGRYLEGLTLRVGSNNVFNEKPPLARSAWSDSGSDTAQYDPFGRTVYVNATYTF